MNHFEGMERYLTLTDMNRANQMMAGWLSRQGLEHDTDELGLYNSGYLEKYKAEKSRIIRTVQIGFGYYGHPAL